MPDFTQYQPPGVYIEEDLSSMVTVTGVAPTVVAIVGPSVGYRTHSESMLLTGTASVALATLGIDQTSVSVVGADGTVYVAGTDYTLLQTAGVDGNVGEVADDPTQISRVDGGAIPDGGLVYVSYHYTDANYLTPLRTRNFSDVQDAFGPPIDLNTGAIVSPLSFAAQIAFENNANELVLVPTAGSADSVTRTQLTDAYAKLASFYDVNVIVPLSVGITGTQAQPGDTINVGSDLNSFLSTSANDGLFRVGILGFSNDATLEPIAALSNFQSRRMVLAWPNRLNYYNGYKNQTIEVSGYYLAAAYAGRIASLPVQMPLTKKQINGFSGFPMTMAQQMSITQKNTWSSAGVAVTEASRTGQLTVRHGTTTDRSNIQTRELSLVRAKDALVELIQQTMDSAGLIGTYIDADTPTRIKGVITGCLEAAKGSEVIIDYSNLAIRTLSTDPSVLQVKFQYKPAYPLNYIVVAFSIDTSTGVASALDTATL